MIPERSVVEFLIKLLAITRFRLKSLASLEPENNLLVSR